MTNRRDQSCDGDVTVFFDEWSVLVVDDNPSALALLRSMLGLLGAKAPLEALDGPTAMELVRQNDLDCIITDIRMEPMNGMEFVRWVRHSNEISNPNVPILAMSAYRDPPEVAAIEHEGANGFIGKPLSLPLLRAALTAIAQNPRHFIEIVSSPGPARHLGDVYGRDED